MATLVYSVAIATKNRPDALKLSIPRILAQSRPPAQLIVVDSSDDHSRVVDVIKEAAGQTKTEVIVKNSKPGLTHQRNIALDLVRNEIVFFPDDDSIWFPGTAECQMKVYERDQGGRVAAVCAMESLTPPDGFNDTASLAYQMTVKDRLRSRFMGMRTALEKRTFPDPAKLIGQRFRDGWARSVFPPPVDARPVEYMTGFRMSFRTAVIRRVRFDETLVGYSLNEDIDASLGVWRHGGVVVAVSAGVFHHKSPERRSGGFRLGVEAILNKAYIVAKHTDLDDEIRRICPKFLRYKVFLYSLRRSNEYGRERFEGGRAAMALVPTVLTSAPHEAACAYRAARDQLLEN